MKKIFIFLLLGITLSFAKINLNSASEYELKSLWAIGPAKARAIIKYREKHPFKSIEELKNVKGIDNQIFERNKDQICIDCETKIEKYIERGHKDQNA